MNLYSRELLTGKPQDLLQHGTYKYETITPDLVGGSGSSVVITTVLGPKTRFRIPDKVVNYHRSFLSVDSIISANAAGAGLASGANLRYNIFADCWSLIKNIRFTSVNGQVVIVNAQNVHKFTKATFRHFNKVEDVMTFDDPDYSIAASGYMFGTFEGLCPPKSCNVSTLAATVPTKANTTAAAATPMTGGGGAFFTATVVTAIQDYVVAGLTLYNASLTATLPVANPRTTNPLTYSFSKFTEPLYLFEVAINSADCGIHHNYRLGMLTDTFFEFDENTYFGQIMELEIEWNHRNAIYYRSDATMVANLSQAVTPATDVVVLKEINLQLCVEQNKDIVADIIDRFNSSGFKYSTPYQYHAVINPSASSNVSLSLEVYPSLGTHLRRIIWVPYNPTEDLLGVYNHDIAKHYDNAGAEKANSNLRSFQTLFDSVPYYPHYLDFAKNQPYLIKRDKLKGSCIGSANEYNHNFTWIEDFTDNYGMGDKPLNAFSKSVMIDCMPITKTHKYDINCMGGSADFQRSNHMWTIVLMNLNVSKTGITLDAMPRGA